MPKQGKQKKLGDFFSSSPIKVTKSKKGEKRHRDKDDAEIINIESSEEEWDGERSKLAPSSQITSITEQKDNGSDSSGPVEMSPVSKRRRRTAAARVVSDVETSGSDDHVPLNLLKKRKDCRVEDSEDDKWRSPAKKRKTLKKGLKPMSEEEDLMAELDSDVLVEARLRTPAKKSAYSKALERRKRDKFRLPAKASLESHSNQESSAEEEDVEIEVEPGTKVKLIPGARLADQQTESSDSDASIDAFVVEDEGDAVTLPPEFSVNQAQPLAVSFKVVFQFLVHIACQPPHLREAYMEARLQGDNSTAEYLRNAVNQLRRTLGSIRDSQVASTIWSAKFRKDLETLPELNIQIIEVEPFCHACRKKVALSTRQATLDGQAYNKLGFEPLEGSSDADSDVDEDSSSSRSEDAIATSFNLGQHCARRVALFHALYHWEYTLFKAIEAAIEALETSNRDKLRETKSKDKSRTKGLIDTDDPDSILEVLDKRRMVNQQWKEIDSMMERAKKIEVRYPGETD